MSSYTTTARQCAKAVVTGKISTGKWVRLACQRQLDDLERFRGKKSPYRFNPKLTDKQGRSFQPADNLGAFVERLPHVKGPLAGQPILLEPWQVFILSTVFGWVKSDGKRRFRRAYVEVPRGSGKSALSSAVALYMLAADGEGGAEVYSLATTRDQARKSYYAFRVKCLDDFSTNGFTGTPTPLDQPLANTASGVYQLHVFYGTNGGAPSLGYPSRTIYKPVAGTVVVAKNGLTISSGLSVDTTTGLITITPAQLITDAITAGCQFDIPCRFNSKIEVTAVDISLRDCHSFDLIERLNP